MNAEERLKEWKGKIADAQKRRDTYQGRLEGLKENVEKLRAKIQEDYGAKDLAALEKAIEKQKAVVEGIEAELEGVLSDAG